MENMKGIQEKRNELKEQLEKAYQMRDAKGVTEAAKGLSELAGKMIRGGTDSAR